MNIRTANIPFEDTGFFSDILSSYLKGDAKWERFISLKPDVNNIPKIIKAKKQTYQFRQELYNTIQKQYQGIDCNEVLTDNIENLSNENTFTITAAHQPVIFGGPLYVALKILHAIKLSNHLKEAFPEYNFVPVYVMGSEDHDFEEISKVEVFGKEIQWNKNAEGPVGRLDLNGFEELFNEFKTLASGSPFADEVFNTFSSCKEKSESFAEFHFHWMHHFFGEKGLVILKPDNTSFKKAMIPVWEKELRESFVQKVTTEHLKHWPQEHKTQATPRDINLFYLTKGKRLRLSREDSKNGIRAVESEIDLPVEEWIDKLKKNPEDFSPNVFLRPSYQCSILPDVVFIGGPSEIAYWLELKSIFETANATFPMLLPRASLMWIDKAKHKKLSKLGITTNDIFKHPDLLIKDLLLSDDEENLKLNDEKKLIEQVFDSILTKGISIDKTLEKAIKGEMQKTLNSIENLELKILRAHKRQNETLVNQIYNLHEKLFPGNTLQERKEAFVTFYLLYGKSFFEMIYNNIDSFTNTFKVVEEQD